MSALSNLLEQRRLAQLILDAHARGDDTTTDAATLARLVLSARKPRARTHAFALYECGICGSYHPWTWSGDCRDNTNRYASVEDYVERHPELTSSERDWILYGPSIASMDDRVAADSAD